MLMSWAAFFEWPCEKHQFERRAIIVIPRWANRLPTAFAVDRFCCVIWGTWREITAPSGGPEEVSAELQKPIWVSWYGLQSMCRHLVRSNVMAKQWGNVSTGESLKVFYDTKGKLGKIFPGCGLLKPKVFVLWQKSRFQLRLGYNRTFWKADDSRITSKSCCM